jgi:hypothetical protein
MRLALLAFGLLSIAACGANTKGDDDSSGDPCSQAMPCKTGEVCDYTNPDGSNCISATGDLDGDGLDNAHDFCDHLPGGSNDEDGDGIGDLCDKCPIAPPPATPDSDNDGVDSPCDPYPDSDGDMIFLFDGFNGTYGSNYVPSPATEWQILGGELVATAGSSSDALMTIPLPQTTNRFGVFTAYRIDALTSDTFDEVAIGAADKRPAGVATITCATERTSTMDQIVVTTDMMSMSDPQSDLFDTAGLFQLTARQDGSLAGCVVIGDNEQDAVQTLVTAAQMSQIDLDVHGATARFEYLLVVGH